MKCPTCGLDSSSVRCPRCHTLMAQTCAGSCFGCTLCPADETSQKPRVLFHRLADLGKTRARGPRETPRHP